MVIETDIYLLFVPNKVDSRWWGMTGDPGVTCARDLRDHLSKKKLVPNSPFNAHRHIGWKLPVRTFCGQEDRARGKKQRQNL